MKNQNSKSKINQSSSGKAVSLTRNVRLTDRSGEGFSMIKQCSKCGEIKNIDCFYYRSDKPHLLQSRCKECLLKDRKEYRKKNIDKLREKDRLYGIKNRFKRNKYLKKYQAKNKSTRAKKEKEKYHSDCEFKLVTNIRNRMRSAIKRNSKSGKSLELLGCSIKEFKIYFEALFTKKMNWSLFMRGKIEIDHILPCYSFDLSVKEDQQKCFHYTNLQPLFAKDNRKKWYKT